MSKFDQAVALLDDLSSEECVALAKAAVQAARRTGRVAATQLGVGSEVVFQNPKTGSTYRGVLTKINRTKAQVKVGGTTWNVPFSLLKTA